MLNTRTRRARTRRITIRRITIHKDFSNINRSNSYSLLKPGASRRPNSNDNTRAIQSTTRKRSMPTISILRSRIFTKRFSSLNQRRIKLTRRINRRHHLQKLMRVNKQSRLLGSAFIRRHRNINRNRNLLLIINSISRNRPSFNLSTLRLRLRLSTRFRIRNSRQFVR